MLTYVKKTKTFEVPCFYLLKKITYQLEHMEDCCLKINLSGISKSK